jgi:triosephosphate isomerase
MRTKLVVGNWKMNHTNAQTAGSIEAFIRQISARPDVDVAICPPYTSLDTARSYLRQSSIKWGAQDVFWKDGGAFTGRVSAPMLLELGCTFCIVGHSETRGRFGKIEVPESTLPSFGETDETINLKVRALLFHGINPIVCVGETEAEREAGETDEVIRRQLNGAFAGFDPAELYFAVVAYEPVWAIGTGKTCDATEADRVCGFIREVLTGILDADVAENIRVIYGGSVKAANARELFNKPNIDGGLVGGASLEADEFSRIVMAA